MNVGLEVEILKWNVRTHRHNFGPFKLTFILSPRSCQFSHGVDRLIGDPSSYVIAILPFVRSRRFEVLLPLLESLIQNRFTWSKMEAEKLQRLHDTLAKLAPRGKVGGLGFRYRRIVWALNLLVISPSTNVKEIVLEHSLIYTTLLNSISAKRLSMVMPKIRAFHKTPSIQILCELAPD